MRTLLHAYLDPKKALTQHYGAIRGLAALGSRVVWILLSHVIWFKTSLANLVMTILFHFPVKSRASLCTFLHILLHFVKLADIYTPLPLWFTAELTKISYTGALGCVAESWALPSSLSSRAKSRDTTEWDEALRGLACLWSSAGFYYLFSILFFVCEVRWSAGVMFIAFDVWSL